MPMGAKEAPDFLMSFIHDIFQDLITAGHVHIYMDDIFIATHDIDTHFQALRQVFDIAQEQHLTFKLSKCKFLQLKVKCLGYLVQLNEIRPGPKIRDAILNMLPPSTKSLVRTLVQTANYFRQFIPNFGRIVAPLTDLLKDGVPFSWTSAHQEAFLKIKAVLLSHPVLLFSAWLQYSHGS